MNLSMVVQICLLYINLFDLIQLLSDVNKISDASHDNPALVRTAAITKKHALLAILLFPEDSIATTTTTTDSSQSSSSTVKHQNLIFEA